MQVTKQFKMTAKKLEGGYMAHSTLMYVLDRNQNIRGLYQMANGNESIDIETIMNDVTELLNE